MPSYQASCSLLGLSLDSTREELRKRYKALALIHHPDKHEGSNQEVWVQYQLAYEAVLAGLGHNQQRSGLGHDQQKSKFFDPDSDPEPTTTYASSWQPKPTPKPVRSWPLRKCPFTLPTTLPKSSSPDAEPYTHTTLTNLHTSHLNLLRTLHTLSATLNTHFLANKTHVSNPNLTRAAEYVSSWLLAEARTHRHLFSLLEATEWWTKSSHSFSGGEARRQVHWYINTYIHGTKGKLMEMRAWLDGFTARHVGKGKKVKRRQEEEFVEKARRYCPEDVQDKGEREDRERQFRDEYRRRWERDL